MLYIRIYNRDPKITHSLAPITHGNVLVSRHEVGVLTPAEHLGVGFPGGGELCWHPAFQWPSAELLEAHQHGHHDEERGGVEVGEAVDEVVVFAAVEE